MAGRPERPLHLQGLAAEAWDELCIQLEKMGLLTQTDWAALSVLCDLWATYTKACEDCEKRGDWFTEQGRSKKNPAYMIKHETGKELARLAGDFGLTPIGRTRVRLKPTDGDEGEGFLRILKMREQGA